MTEHSAENDAPCGHVTEPCIDARKRCPDCGATPCCHHVATCRHARFEDGLNDTAENDAPTLTEQERELLSGLCDVDAPRGAGHDGYCYAHHSPVRWAGRANANEVCCVDVEDHVEEVLVAWLTRVIPPASGGTA